VADDGSGPEIPRALDEYRGRFRHPIQHVWHPDQGFRKTRIANLTVAKARAPYLIFVDGDSICHRRFVESHLAARAPRVVLAGRRVMMTERSAARVTAEEVASGALENPWRHRGETLEGSFFRAFRVPWIDGVRRRFWHKGTHVWGANFSVHAEDYRAVNGYDEAIVGRGLEDDNLSNRFKLSGREVVSVARSALQYHLFHRSDPGPHDAATVERFHWPPHFWAEDGLVKKPYDGTEVPLSRSDVE
jgi:hypothetical protein